MVLLVGGRRELLGFPEKLELGGGSTGARVGEGVAAIRSLIPAEVSGMAPAGPSALPPTSALSADFRTRVTDDPRSLLSSLGAAPTPQGYRVGPNPSPQTRLAGLLPGDLVQKVNGAEVGDLESDRQLFDRVMTSGQARVQVLRDGRQITLSFPLR